MTDQIIVESDSTVQTITTIEVGPQGPPGEIGPAGPAGADGLVGADGKDGVGITWAGVWSAETPYAADQCVQYNGSAYISTAETTGDIPGIAAVWELWVSQGDQGPTGPAGAAGADGQDAGPLVTSWAATPLDTNVPSEKLVKDSIDGKSDTSHSHSSATTGAAGFMSSTDKSKLDGIASGATAYTDAAARSAVIASSISDNDTTHSPDGNSVFDALAGTEKYHGVESIGTIAFDAGTKVLSLSSITYWYKGTRYTTASSVTCDLDLTADRDHASATLTDNTLYYFRFIDATGKLYWSPSAWDLHESVSVATVFWNGSAGAVNKESHGHRRDIDWHIWAHSTVGARYVAGLDKTYPTTATDGSLQIETGTIYDEDLSVSTGQQTTMRGWYKASAGVYTFADYSLPYLGTTGAPVYLDTDTYILTTFASNKYGCYWVYATTDKDKPIAIIPSHVANAHTLIADARAETQPTITGLNPEWKLIYRWIYTGDGQFIESTDYRLQTSLAGGISASTTAGAVAFSPSGNVAATNVQAAIEELDTELSVRYYGAVFDGGGSAIVADKKAYVRIPKSGTITSSYIMADVSGTISVEVWKDTFANFPPTVADKISASAPIALSSAQSGEDTTLTGWTKTVTAGDVICFNVSALATSITWCAVGVVVQ